MWHKYGKFTKRQIFETKKKIKTQIFFLLLYVDPKTSGEYPNVCVEKCFKGLLKKLGGMNELLLCQPELVSIMSLLQAALNEYVSDDFDFQIYRKLILDAGSEIDNLKEV